MTSSLRSPSDLIPSRVRSWSSVALALMLAALISGCAAFAGSEPSSGWDVGADRDETVQLEISNQNFKDARVYTLWDGERRRLGTVTGNTRRSFTIQWRPGATLRLEVDFVAGGGFVSSGLSTWPGESWEFVIPSYAE